MNNFTFSVKQDNTLTMEKLRELKLILDLEELFKNSDLVFMNETYFISIRNAFPHNWISKDKLVFNNIYGRTEIHVDKYCENKIWGTKKGIKNEHYCPYKPLVIEEAKDFNKRVRTLKDYIDIHITYT